MSLALKAAFNNFYSNFNLRFEQRIIGPNNFYIVATMEILTVSINYIVLLIGWLSLAINLVLMQFA